MRVRVAPKYGIFKHGPGYRGVPSLRAIVPEALGLEPLVQRGSLILLHDQAGEWISERWSGYVAWLAFELPPNSFEACPGDQSPPPTSFEVYQKYEGPVRPDEIRRLGVDDSLEGLEEIVGDDGLARLREAQQALRESKPASEFVVARYPDTESCILASQAGRPGGTETILYQERREDPANGAPSYAVRPSLWPRWLSRVKGEYPEKAAPAEPKREPPLPVVLPWVEVSDGYLPVEARIFMRKNPGLFLCLRGLASDEPRLSLQGLEVEHRRGQVDRLLRGMALLREMAPVGRKPLEETEWSAWREQAKEGLNLKRRYPSLKWSAIARRLDLSERTLRRHIVRLGGHSSS